MSLARAELEEKQAEKYADIEHQLRTAIDAQYGISREKKVSDPAYPTGAVIVRNASRAKEISDPSVDQQKIEQNYMLLRCLGRLRGIDYVLKEMAGSSECSAEQKKGLNKLINKLSADFELLIKESDTNNHDGFAKQKLKKFRERVRSLEKNFNTNTLCEVLHQANLDEGCVGSKDYEKLLFHYRNLSTLLDPMPSLVTVTYDANNSVLHRITQDPITKKLPQQKQAIEREMGKTVLFPTAEEMTFQTSQKMAMQVANGYFAKLAAKDDRMLGGQAHKTHLYGATNAFFVTNELVWNVTNEEVETDPLLIKEGMNTQSFARSASLVYVGEGENDARTQQSARDNIEQIRQFIIGKLLAEKSNLSSLEIEELKKSIKIHYTCLITDSPLEKQGFVLGHVVRATRNNKEDTVDYSYAPCNWDGTHRRLDLSNMVEAESRPSIHPTPSNQAERYRRVAQVSLTIRGKKENRLFELVGCMRGLDRSETESEYTTQLWARQCYKTRAIHLDKDLAKGDVIESTRAKGRNSAEINNHVNGGSPGCKNDSRGKTAFIDYDNLYSPTTDQAMYLKDAVTNKENKVVAEKLKKIIATPSEIATMQYNAAFEKLRQTFNNLKEDDPKRKAAMAVWAEFEKIHNRITPHERSVLIRILNEVIPILEGPSSNALLYAEHITRLGAIVKTLNKKSRWKQLAGVLLILGGMALVAAGLVLAIPSGGSSLLMTMLSAKVMAIAVGLSLPSVPMIASGITLAGFAGAYFGTKIAKEQIRQSLEKESTFIKSLETLQKKGAEENYIAVPFPPAFSTELYNSLPENDPLKEIGVWNWLPSIINIAEVDQFLVNENNEKQVAQDLKRLVWQHKNETLKLPDAERFQEYQCKMKEKMPELNLTLEETKVLLALSTMKEKKWQQGGIINIGSLLFGVGAALPLGVTSNSMASFDISRSEDASFIIKPTLKPEEHHRISDDVSTQGDYNPYQYRETYKLSKEGADWKLTLLPNNSLHVHPMVWRHMLERAKDQLREEKTPFAENQLFYYVPLLIDKDFAEVFKNKLKDNPDFLSQNQLLLLEKLILKCHGPHTRQPEHILQIRYEINKIQKADSSQLSKTRSPSRR